MFDHGRFPFQRTGFGGVTDFLCVWCSVLTKNVKCLIFIYLFLSSCVESGKDNLLRFEKSRCGLSDVCACRQKTVNGCKKVHCSFHFKQTDADDERRLGDER